MSNKYEIYAVTSEMWKCDEKYFPNTIAFRIQWTANVGWGQLGFTYNTSTNEWDIDNECMSEEFCQAVLNKWLHGIYTEEQKIQKLEDEVVEIDSTIPIVATSDSETIASLLSGFEYHPEKKDAILEKYDRLIKD